MTAPDLGPCVCGAEHEHSDFAPYPCADCEGCSAHNPGVGTETIQTATDARNHRSVLIPASALGFAEQNVTQAAAWIDSVLSWAGAGEGDARAVCDFADALETLKPGQVDPMIALAVALHRLTTPPRRPTARQALKEMRRKVQR